ncbi:MULTISPECIES: LysE/ArgO family amino acid transporter [Oerskovia]|uniref:Arginine exporter protein ArgO n=1 Tax=Oerskovia enterophila TaxID=43678 RepID=A0ABX2Y698_9CELL|nr:MULTISPECIES: LysE family transporter [Oerskovia]KRD45872.1 lysine transporter LysE [Oerskovia sp. Root918]OCI31777.1 arginine exporter protein ArgO [Oerskovia enterophila]
MTSALLAGLVAGYAIAIPVGAIAVYLVTLTARTRFAVGAAAGLGTATADGIYATVAVVAGAVVAPLVAAVRTPLTWASVAVLAVLAWRTFRPALQRVLPDGATPRPATADTTPVRAYATLLGLTLVNPATVIYFAVLVAGGALSPDATGAERAVFVLAAFVASASWQMLVAGGGAVLGRALTNDTGQRVTAAVGGLVILALAVHLALGA